MYAQSNNSGDVARIWLLIFNHGSTNNQGNKSRLMIPHPVT
jgi:hypothetical protein